MSKVNLGDEVKDSITGFAGVAIGRTTWLTGCDRIVVQPKGLTKDGKLFDTISVDEPLLIVTKAKKPVEGEVDRRKGGPMPNVSKGKDTF